MSQEFWPGTLYPVERLLLDADGMLAWPGTEGIGRVLSVAYAPKWSRQALDQI